MKLKIEYIRIISTFLFYNTSEFEYIFLKAAFAGEIKQG
jgi:hypothetical protein